MTRVHAAGAKLLKRGAVGFVRIVLFCALPTAFAHAQSSFSAALTSPEFEALLPRAGVPESAHAAAMEAFDRYQKATSELRLGGIERYLSSYHGRLGRGWDSDDVPVESVRERVRVYRGLLSQWESIESLLLDSLAGLGADPAKLGRMRNSLEGRRIAQTAGAGSWGDRAGSGDLMDTCDDALRMCTEEERALVDARLAAREGEWIEALRSMRIAALAEPELLAGVPVIALTTPKEFIDAVAQAQREAAANPESKEAKDALVDAANAMWAEGAKLQEQARAERETALQAARAPLRNARQKVRSVGASIIESAFEGVAPPAGAAAWVAFMRSSHVGRHDLMDGGAISLVRTAAQESPLSPEQSDAIYRAFAQWQAGVATALREAPPMGEADQQSAHSKRQEAADERTRALVTAVRTALGMAPVTEESRTAGRRRASGGGAVTFEGTFGIIDGAAIELVASGEPLMIATEGIVIDGGSFESGAFTPPIMLGGEVFEIDAIDSGPVTPLSKGSLRAILTTCAADEEISAVAEQLHRDYLALADSTIQAWKDAPSATARFDQSEGRVIAPTPEDIRAHFAALKQAIESLTAIEGEFFENLATVMDPSCIRQQREARLRGILLQPIAGRGWNPMGQGDSPVDPEAAISAGLEGGAIDAATAQTLRDFISDNHHAVMESALRASLAAVLAGRAQAAAIEAASQHVEGDMHFMALDQAQSERMEDLQSRIGAAADSARACCASAVDALAPIVPEHMRTAFIHEVDAARNPGVFRDPTRLEPYFSKALALEGVAGTGAAEAVTGLRAEYRREYEEVRSRLDERLPKSIPPEWEEVLRAAENPATAQSAVLDFKARQAAAEGASRQMEQIRRDREELNRRWMRRLKAALVAAVGEERAKEVGELPQGPQKPTQMPFSIQFQSVR